MCKCMYPEALLKALGLENGKALTEQDINGAKEF